MNASLVLRAGLYLVVGIGALASSQLFAAAANGTTPPYDQKDIPTLPTIVVTAQPITDTPTTCSLANLGSVSFYYGGFLWHYSPFNAAPTTQSHQNKNGGCQSGDARADPIEISYGSKIEKQVLFALPGEMGLRYELNYRSLNRLGDVGHVTDNFSYSLDLACSDQKGDSNCIYVRLWRPDGSIVKFNGNPTASGNHPVWGGIGLVTLNHNSDGTWTLHDEDATTQTYNSNGQLSSIKDASGIGWTLTYTGTYPGPYTTVVTHTNGSTVRRYSQEIVVNGRYTGDNVTVTDPAGNVYTIVLNPYGEPTSITYPGSPQTVITYKYDNSPQSLQTEVDYNGIPYSYTTYETCALGQTSCKATGTYLADGSEATSIVYTFPSQNTMTAKITNPLGHVTTNQYGSMYDTQYLLTSVSEDAVSDGGATVRSRYYDGNANLSKTVDNNGITHAYSYASNGQLQTETEASGTAVARKTDYAWDPNSQLNRLLSVTVEGESRTTYSYNAQNRIASVARTNLSANGVANQTLTTTYSYALYGNGMVQSMTVTVPSPGGTAKTTTNYDTLGNVTSVVDGLGYTTTYSNYNGLGEPGKVVGQNGDETDYTYDARGRVASKTTHPNGTAATWNYVYDGFGLLSQLSAPDGEVTSWSRDAEMRVKTITHNDKDGTSTETFGYDANSDVTSDVIARGGDVGKSTTTIYDALGRVYQRKGNHGQVLTYAYDGNGNVLSVTDALGHKTSYAYDALNRLADVTDAAGGVTAYLHDAGDHTTRVTDPRGLVTNYAWDGLGLLWQQQSPDTGSTGFSYDTYGRLASKIRADGTQTTYAYDSLNRLTSETAGGATRTYTWDVCTNGKGRFCAASLAGSNSVGYSYSPEGWITGRDFAYNGGTSYGLGFAYDNMGHLSVVDYPDGNQALYDYSDGVVSDVRLKVGSYLVTGISGISYRPMNLAMSAWTSYNGLSNTIGYDNDLRATSITVPNVESLSFAYDVANRIVGITNGANSSLSQTLGYDALDRLTSENGSAENESYQYDADGNRSSQVVNGAATSFGYVPGTNRLSSASGGMSATYGYDANGNLTTLSGRTAYSYGPFNRLVNADGASFVISAEGQRIEKLFGTGATYFAPDASGTLLAEFPGNWRDYVWLNGRLVTVISNGGVFPLHDDQTGRPLYMTDPNSGTQIDWAAEGLPFDSSVTTNAWGNFNIGFPGQYFDSENGLWQNGNRDYDPLIGRYIESDPIGLKGGINTYAYVNSNPVSGTDPLGLEGPGSWTFPAGSPDAQMYQNAKNGCYDRQAEEILAIAVTQLILAGPGDPLDDAATAGEITLFRVFGDEAQGLGKYHTTVDPAVVEDYRTVAGLYPGNSGSFVLEGTLNDTEGVTFTQAAPGPGGVGGGLPEVYVPNPETQITIQRVSGVNPSF